MLDAIGAYLWQLVTSAWFLLGVVIEVVDVVMILRARELAQRSRTIARYIALAFMILVAPFFVYKGAHKELTETKESNTVLRDQIQDLSTTTRYFQENAPRDTQFPYGILVTIQTGRVTQPLRLLVECDAAIRKADFIFDGVGGYQGPGVGVSKDPQTFQIFIDSPAFSPQHNIRLLLYSDRPITAKRVRPVL